LIIQRGSFKTLAIGMQDSIILAIPIRRTPQERLKPRWTRVSSAISMGLIQKIVGWTLALVLLAMFPWMLFPALIYWTWKRGILKRALRRVSGWAKERNLKGMVACLNASVSTDMASDEAVIHYETPCEDSPYVVVQMIGERRILIASCLKEEAGTRGDYGSVVAAIMALLGGLSWSITFAFFLSGSGEVGGLIALDRPAPESGSDPGTVSREIMGQIAAVEKVVASVAPSLSVRSLKGKELAPLALWGVFR
jgi:hypothetical protein